MEEQNKSPDIKPPFSLKEIPESPGCYRYYDKDGTIIYVGKAKNLKKRVSQYFQKTEKDPKTTLLVADIAGIDFFVTDTEVEAFILENNLIKKHMPKYNIDLKDAKSYAYIEISNDKFPRIGIARRRKTGDGTLYGPFVSAAERDQVLSFLKQTFHLRTCRKMHKRSCLRYHLGTCLAPCENMVSESEYSYQIKSADMVLKGKNSELLRDLKKDMENFSENEEFERALVIRDQINALKKLSERQYVQRQKNENEHIINYQVSSGKVYLMMFSIEKGILSGKEEFVFPYDEEFIEEFIIQYYSGDNLPPQVLILPEEINPSIEEYLSKIKGTVVHIIIPKQGDRKHLLTLVEKNIEASFFRGQVRSQELAEALSLESPPIVIESFDISHLGGTGTVGSMVSFREGRPDKSNYRRFRIKTAGNDDFTSIGEVVRRRYSRLKKEEHPMPDLIIIDGGKGQLASACEELKKLDLQIPIISIAKREEEIFIPNRHVPLPIKKKDPASLLIQEIRDETHRFAITYQRTLRTKQIRR